MSSAGQLLLFLGLVAASDWDQWWTYDAGLGGPKYWSLNKDWLMCGRGQRQSPVDINPQLLLFDKHLSEINIDRSHVSGTLSNTGQVLRFNASQSGSKTPSITGGPLGAYGYNFQMMHLHFGDDGQGSEHTIAGRKFPAEIQLLAYNADLYRTFDEASKSPYGLAGVAVMLYPSNVREQLNPEVRLLCSVVSNVTHKGQSVHIDTITFHNLVPRTKQYVTYEGSTTAPGCYETVTWIVINQPAYISPQDMARLRSVSRSLVGAKEREATMANNVRPLQPLNDRPVRTNIKVQSLATCGSGDSPDLYRPNPAFPWEKSKNEL